MTTYKATIKHHSISRARVIDVSAANLTAAKRKATAEFGKEQRDYTIVIMDERGEQIASRRAGGGAWLNNEY